MNLKNATITATRILEELHARAFRILIALFVLAATLIEWAAIPPIYPLTRLLCIIAVIAVILSPFLPRTASWLIIAGVIARLFILDLSGPNPLWAAYLALALIGYDSSIPVAIGALTAISLAECVPVALSRFNALSATWVGMVNYVGMFVFATMIGMALRWRRQRDESRERAMDLERRQWRLDTLQRNTRLASRIHDSASGGLSYIALTAQRQLRRIPDDDTHAGERADWRFVDEQARHVLDEIHRVIDLLERSEDAARRTPATDSGTDADRMGDATDATPAESPRPNGDMIGDAVREARRRLDHLGFTGTMELRGVPEHTPADIPPSVRPDRRHATDEPAAQAANLIGEIASNIIRHLDPAAGAYRAVVTLGEHAIEIMETNPLPATPKPADVAPHGSGLELHRRIIARLGGELNTSAEDGDWIIYARIPLDADDEHPVTTPHTPSDRRRPADDGTAGPAHRDDIP
ncbi:hypothetical protein CPA40_01910 [Bifidobacterium callitrichos]|uniref:histidine kinase n=1 Tax=Bifidobacterium callitrichos TaxID=762209 RepID=A0A2T3GCA7_9BIFI|nr:hypothetical protein [Bifidobacterium callitrichos]PST47102.1 hypothetical protein CPA40_01910 [Bifidobacterium callitrichos]